MPIEISEELRKALRALSREERLEIGGMFDAVASSFGKPHIRAGIGIRKLAAGVYECRLNIDRRFIFTAASGSLFFHTMGSHDEVKRFLKGL